jgi:hypothetical protein
VNTMYEMDRSDGKTRHVRHARHSDLSKVLGNDEIFQYAEGILSEKSHHDGECILWLGSCTASGYGKVTIRGGGYLTHRLAWSIANNDTPPKGMHVMHACDVRNCINPLHLSVGTPADNLADARSKNRIPPRAKGAASAKARWTEADVLEAAQMRADGWSLKNVARYFGVGESTVSHALCDRQWKHLLPQIRAIYKPNTTLP